MKCLLEDHYPTDHLLTELSADPRLHRTDVECPPPPQKRYRTIVVDPPWQYRVSSLPPSSRAATGHRSRAAAENYGTLAAEAIAEIPVGDWADTDAHLYIWATNAFMVEAHDLMRVWRFEHKTILTWVKPNVGMGHYYRNTTEHVLFGVRGRLKALNTNTRTDFRAPRGKHSEKPAAFYDMVESMSPGPYLDVFARRHRFNWDTYGNEVYTDIPLVETKQ
jgi:N6-adenosine-specific RNA methylase IME4